MPTPIPGTFQARNSISFSQIASEYNQVDDGTREIKFSDYYLNNGIVDYSNSPLGEWGGTNPDIVQSFENATAPDIPRNYAVTTHDISASANNRNADPAPTSLTTGVNWVAVGNITGLKVANVADDTTGTSFGNQLSAYNNSLSNDTGHFLKLSSDLFVVPDWLKEGYARGHYYSWGYNVNTAHSQRAPSNYINADGSPRYLKSPSGRGWCPIILEVDSLNRSRKHRYCKLSSAILGQCGTSGSNVPADDSGGLSSSQIAIYENPTHLGGFTWGGFGQYAPKIIYNPAGLPRLNESTLGTGRPDDLQMSYFYSRKNIRKALKGVATATATGVIV